MRRVGIFGWGVVAPRSPNIEAFRHNLQSSESWLTPFNGFGTDNFLVGTPEFSFSDYKPWIDERFSPNRFQKLDEKMGWTTKFAIGTFIQALDQNPGLEQELSRLGSGARVYFGTGLGSLTTIQQQTLLLAAAQRHWDRFWASPQRNSELSACRDGTAPLPADAPPDPESLPDDFHRDLALDEWNHYWASRSSQLKEYLKQAREIESVDVVGDVHRGKVRAIKLKRRLIARLQKKWHAPDPPWSCVSANLIWNLQNTPASQISMLGKITGMAFAPVAACSTFGLSLKLGLDAIRSGEAKAVVVGATDPPPHPLTVGAFYQARVIAADGQVSKPLSGLRGTHISGGAVVWIIGDLEHMTERGFKPLGMEPVSVGVTSDADHIITPSKEGPTNAIDEALAEAQIPSDAITSWDLHATATPGDYMEVENLKDVVKGEVVVTARKGTFGHGMSAGGGWELTAQYMAQEGAVHFPTPLEPAELNEEIGKKHSRFVFNEPCSNGIGPVGKLSMGIGGINACVISRPWKEEDL